MNTADLKGTSLLERAFALRWSTIVDAPQLTREYRFQPYRRWRFDFANTDSLVAIEIDGALWKGRKGGHGGAGAIRDREKDFDAAMLGWVVIRLTPEMAKDRARLEKIADLMWRRSGR